MDENYIDFPPPETPEQMLVSPAGLQYSFGPSVEPNTKGGVDAGVYQPPDDQPQGDLEDPKQQLEELRQRVEMLEQIVCLAPAFDRVFWARITGTTTGGYAWIEQTHANSLGLTDFTNGRIGTVGIGPGVEVNGSTLTITGKVLMVETPDVIGGACRYDFAMGLSNACTFT